MPIIDGAPEVGAGAARTLTSQRTTVRLQIAVSLVSATLLALQIAFTRILSVVVDFHMVFLVLSAAMLGVGLPGAWLILRPPSARTPVRALLIAAPLVPASVAVLLQFGSPDLEHTLPLAIVCLTAPFLALGTAAVALLIEAEGESFRRVYAADLVGGAVGALGVIALLDWIPTPALTASLAFPVTLTIVWLGNSRERAAAAGIAVAAFALIVWGAPLRVHYTKNYDETKLDARVIEERWSSTTRLAVFDRPFFFHTDQFFTWGPGRNAPPEDHHRERWIEQDGGAGTPVMAFKGDFRKLSSLDYDVTSLGYQIRPATEVLVVGPGGGRDILTALRQGAHRVRAVEVNRGMIELMKGPLAAFSGRIYFDPRVDVQFAEARSYLARDDNHYDAVQISLIDSFASTAAGAHALSEGYLYTVQAMRTFLGKLEPRGVLSISRWYGAESSRLLGTMSAAIAAQGWTPAGDHLLAERSAHVVTVLASPAAFTPEERRRAADLATLRGWDVVYPVTGSAANECVASLGAHCARPPATDDRPFFFIREPAFARVDGSTQGLDPIRRVAVLSAFGLLFSLLLPLLRERKDEQLAALGGGLYYVLIGIAFMLVEVGLSHRFVEYVGHPTTSAAVVLAGLLLGAGVGSYVLPERSGRQWLIGTSLVIAIVGLSAPGIFNATRAFGPAMRGLVAALLSAGVAVQLGAWFPSGLTRWGDQRKAWFWLVNGTASVVGGMLALGIAIDLGFRVVFLMAAGLYLLAAALLVFSGRARPARLATRG